MITTAYYLARHDPNGSCACNVGQKVEFESSAALDGIPAPACPLTTCDVENHRMELVSELEYFDWRTDRRTAAQHPLDVGEV